MVEHFELGGKKRPVLYGMAAFKMLRKRTGMSMSDFLGQLQSGELDALSDITYCALRVGEIYEDIKEVDEYDEMKVAVWMDGYKGGVVAFMNKLVESLPKLAAGEGDAEPGEAQANLGTGTS